MTSDELRKAFLGYFEKKGHRILPSSPLIPKSDPTLLFTNAGMVQFKGIFLGEEKVDFTRAATIQKCLRAGGKQSDLERVGKTARHHTFFEMLGNFSFGDYFKEEAILVAWEFLTDIIGLPEDRLWVSIFREDDDAAFLWRDKIGLPEERIVRLGEEDNFWKMGDTGPCGPCSEIIIDQGAEVGCKRPTCAVGCDCDRFLELWNLVFIQYNRDEKGVLTKLPNPGIDTGMGIERLAAVTQGTLTNFESDIFLPIINTISEVSGVRYGSDKTDFSLKVIADHIRAITFLLSEGILPSNEGRGYVLRRIIRRAARHGRLLGIEGPFLYRLVDSVVKVMSQAYPELTDRKDYIERFTAVEEERFSNTLEIGLKILRDMIDKSKDKEVSSISGDDLFTLYDTYGFPLDLSQDIAQEEGLIIDEEGFHKAMEGQKLKAKAAWAGSGEERIKDIYRKVSEIGRTVFTGYEELQSDTKIIAIGKDDTLVESAKEGEEVEFFLNKTPFHGEAGGQVGDTGIFIKNSSRAIISNAIKPVENLISHKGKVIKGEFRVGDIISAEVDIEQRKATARNHTATHILHATLREVLGDHVKQAGSLVAPDRLRFDFTHFSSLREKEIDSIEERVNRVIMENILLETEVKGIEEALSSGAIALFGEKYGEKVRVVGIKGVSSELCGGTHLRATGEIGLFKIVSETGIAAGVRRIEALTGESALRFIKEGEKELISIARLLKSSDLKVSTRVERLQGEKRDIEREIEALKGKISTSRSATIIEKAKEIAGIKVIAEKVEGADIKDLRIFADSLRDRLKSGVLVLGSTKDGKVSFIAMVTKDLTGRFHAGKIIKEVAAIAGGTGGGKAEMAEAGGKDPDKLDEAMKKVYEIIEKKAAT
ncbi:MAG: alanine--tRNA ligase [Nitrospirota bacterium]